MNPEKKIKLQAKNALNKGNQVTAVSTVLIIFAAFIATFYLVSGIDYFLTAILEPLNEYIGSEIFVAGTLSTLFIIPCIILLVPLVMGVMRFFYKITKEEEVAFSEVFYFISKRFFSALGVFLHISIRCLWQIAICLLPSYLELALITHFTQDKEELAFSDHLWYLVVYALIFVHLYIFLRLTTRYFLSFFLYFEDETIDPRELCDLSCRYMDRFENSVMKLITSLFPWIISCILIFPCLFVIPFVLTSLSTSAKWIIALNHQKKNEDE